MTNDLQTTLRAIQQNHWRVVLLKPGTKRIQGVWQSTNDVKVIKAHLDNGGGIGLDAYESNVVVLDIDNMELSIKACLNICPLPAPTVGSPSGGRHCYVALPEGLRPEDLPAKIMIDGELLGEVMRGPRQQTVMPPSPYPGNLKRNIPSGGYYTWLNDPTLGIPVLPEEWVKYLIGERETAEDFSAIIGDGAFGLPDFVMKADEWEGPPPATVVRLALARLRRARPYKSGAKGQCPQCSADGHDKHYDNAFVNADGRWGCAFAPGDATHRRAIGIALGIVQDRTDSPRPIVYDDVPRRTIIEDTERSREWKTILAPES